MDLLDKSKIIRIIKNHYNMDLDLKQGYYSKFELNNKLYISYSTFKLTDEEQLSQGILIMEYRDHWYLLPAALDLILGIENLQIKDREKIVETTFGRKTTENRENGFFLITDNYNRLIALAKMEAGQIIPLVDIGLYLRFES